MRAVAIVRVSETDQGEPVGARGTSRHTKFAGDGDRFASDPRGRSRTCMMHRSSVQPRGISARVVDQVPV
jgi:hypothetical protein